MTPYQASEAQYHQNILKQYEEGTRSTTSLQKNARYLVKIGAAKDEQEAVDQLHHSVTDPARRATLLRAWTDTILKNDSSIGGDVDAARAKAEQILGQQFSTSQGTAPTVTPGSTPETALPDPGEGKRTSGIWYINPATGKPDRWR